MLYLRLRAGQGGGEGREGAGARGPGTHHPGERCTARRRAHRAAREATPDPERGTRPRAARGRRCSRGAPTCAQFPETRLPERPQPCIHDAARSSMFTEGRNQAPRHPSGKDPRAHRRRHVQSTSKLPHVGTVGHAWSPKSRARTPRRTPPPPPRTTCRRKVPGSDLNHCPVLPLCTIPPPQLCNAC